MTSVSPQKASTILRFLAKLVDLLCVLIPSVFLPYPVGVLLGFLYTLVHDGIFQGRSIGKRFFKLQVLIVEEDGKTKPCDYRQSVIRNATLGVATFFAIIPFWGWILLVLLGLPLVLLESYLMIRDPKGLRLGDVMAETQVFYHK